MPEGEARWIADPTHRHELRWWNGARWTEHVSDDGVAGVDWGPKGPPPPRPVPPARPSPSAPLDEDDEWRGVLEESPQRQRERERRRTFGLIVGMVVLVAAAIAVAVVVSSGGR